MHIHLCDRAGMMMVVVMTVVVIMLVVAMQNKTIMKIYLGPNYFLQSFCIHLILDFNLFLCRQVLTLLITLGLCMMVD